MFFNWKFEDVTAFKILQKHSGKIETLIKKKNQYTVSFIGEAGKDHEEKIILGVLLRFV